MVFSDGSKYEGTFQNDSMFGRGKYYFNDGSMYEGEFTTDAKDGTGIMFYSNGEAFRGQWRKDKKEREGYYLTKPRRSRFTSAPSIWSFVSMVGSFGVWKDEKRLILGESSSSLCKY